jgi:hypothetical protein
VEASARAYAQALNKLVKGNVTARKVVEGTK